MMPRPEKPPTVLVIEDDESLASLIAYFLHRSHFRPIVAHDGATGLQMARLHSPSIIMCDSCLPELNGLQVLGALRANPSTAKLPIILMSGYPKPCIDGPVADAFLLKPFRREEMLALVRCLIEDASPEERGLLAKVA